MYSALVVDDNAVDRIMIARALGGLFPQLEIRFAHDPYVAREMIVESRPSFLLLDVDLPRMSGGEFLGHLHKHDPVKVIVVSGDSFDDSDRMAKLKERGASDVLTKPDTPDDMGAFRSRLFESVRRICPEIGNCSKVAESVGDESTHATDETSDERSRLKCVIGIGASTGGPPALEKIVAQLTANCPPIVIAQHMKESLIESLVDRLNQCSQAKVQIAQQGQQIMCGNVYVASSAGHIEVTARGRIHCLERRDGDHLAPSVDILFRSLAKSRPQAVIAALLTGMGDDGAKGLAAIRSAGGRTIAQDEATCAIFGMPARAIERNAVEMTLPIDAIYPQMLAWQLHMAEGQTNRGQAMNVTYTADANDAADVWPRLETIRQN